MTLAGVAPAPLFSVESVVRDAQAQAGMGEDGPFEHLDSLEVLLDSLDREARLTPGGRADTRRALVSSLAVQPQVRRLLAEHPEIAGGPAARPVFVIGLLRSGTTLVHNLLDQHPALRCPHLWELMTPVGSRDPAEHDRLAGAAQGYLDAYHRLAPRLPMIHPMGARRPDECHRLMGNSFQSMIYWARYRVPSYARWLRDRDLTEAFRFHRAQLACILWRLPGEVVVLKCPFHVWSLGPLVEVYPEARFVHLHRDPATTVPSTCSLCAEIMGARSDRVDRAEVGAFWLSEVEWVAREMLRARHTHLAGRPVLDVRYQDLMADTMATMRRICEFLEAPMTGEADAAMRRWLAENPADRHGTHRYAAEEFGLDPGDLAGRFTEYRREFDL
jgi:Sulfotransferase family